MISTIVWIFVILAVPPFLNLLFKWIYLPLKLRHKHPPLIEQLYQPTSIHDLTMEQREVIGEYIQQFKTEGFEVAANLSIQRGPKEVSAVVILLVNRTTGDIAQMILTLINIRRDFVFVIHSHFPDGRHVVTGCNPDVGFMPKNPQVDSIGFGWVRQVAAVAEAHRRRLNRLGLANVPRETPEAGHEIAYLQQRRKRELGWFVESGYYYPDGAAGILRKTWKGTFLTVWKLQQPIKRLRLSRRDRKARKTWIELGMGKWDAGKSVDLLGPPRDSVELVPSAPVSTLVSYEAILDAGEMRIARNENTAVIRLGKPTVLSYLLMRWASLLWITGSALAMTVYVPEFWFFYQLRLHAGIPFRFMGGGLLANFGIFLYFLIASLVSVISGLQRTRGTSVVTASSAGLTFENAPCRRSRGVIRREELQNLLIVRTEIHLFQSLHQLEAVVLPGSFRQPLLVATSLPKLQEAKKSMATALGIKTEEKPALSE